MAEVAEKIIIPKRKGGNPLAPESYWYAASKSGVVPAELTEAVPHPMALKWRGNSNGGSQV